MKIGDKVVMLNWDNNRKVYIVHKLYEHKIYENNGEYAYSTFIYQLLGFPDSDRWFSKRHIRLALNDEIKLNRRLH